MLLNFEATVYLLCFLGSGLCAYLLVSAFRRSSEKLLLWSAVCFCLLAVNNLLVFVDIIVFPDLNLTALRSLTSLAAVSALLYGFIWEIE
jgi:hypothetical protein